MAVSEDLDIKIGDSFFSKQWAVLISGSPVDLTDGWTVRAQIRTRPGASVLLHDFTDGIIVTAPIPAEDDQVVPSTVQLRIPADVAETLTEWVGVWDLEIEHPTFGLGGGLYRKTILSGTARTTWDVSR